MSRFLPLADEKAIMRPSRENTASLLSPGPLFQLASWTCFNMARSEAAGFRDRKNSSQIAPAMTSNTIGASRKTRRDRLSRFAKALDLDDKANVPVRAEPEKLLME